MDKYGYPDEEELATIKGWKGDDLPGLMEYINDLWKYADCGYWTQEGNEYQGQRCWPCWKKAQL